MLAAASALSTRRSRVLQMIDMMRIEESVRASWLKARSHAMCAAAWCAEHPSVALGLLYGTLVYLASAVLIGVPGRAILALLVAGPAGWWCVGRYKALVSAQTPRLCFFSGENGPLCLSEDIVSPKLVYCIGLRNEGAKAISAVRVAIEGIEGYPPSTPAGSLPIFRNPADQADLQPGESEYFCVMRRMEGAEGDEGRIVLCCHRDFVAPGFGLGELVGGRAMTLTASSAGAPQTTKRVRISSQREEAGWSLDLQLLPDTGTPPIPVVEHSPIARPTQDSDPAPMPAAEQPPAAQPPMPDADTAPLQAAEQGLVADPAVPEPEAPAVEAPIAQRLPQEPSLHSERVRRLLARHGRT